MHEYSVTVALFDYLPVLLSAAGLAWLALGIAARYAALAPVAWAAALVIPLGGFCKATWKLLIALDNPPLDWLENLLFIAMAPGFVAMAFCLHQVRRTWIAGDPLPLAPPHDRLVAWLGIVLAGGIIAAMLWPDSRAWFFWLLAVTTLATITLMIQAIRTSRGAGLGWPVTTAFGYTLVGTIAMGGLARLPPGEATAWIQEGTNLSAQAAFAFAAWKLGSSMREPQ